MKTRLRSLLAVSALLPLVSCDKPAAPAAAVPSQNTADLDANQAELAEARDALQRQALEIETRSALMEKQLAEMEKAVKDQENSALRDSLAELRKQNDELEAKAEEARRQSNALSQRIAITRPQVDFPPQVEETPDYSLFYDQLEPYGRWMDVSGYGYCWRPTITTAGWRPYVDGCWVWSSLGWTWQSNEAFGWAVYHYGRWVNLAYHGWVWVPGNEWAPGWVSWRQSRDYVGWAPLPPTRGATSNIYRDCDSQYNLGPTSYTFITINHFVQPSYVSYCAPVSQCPTIFQNSVNVTQIVRRPGGSGGGHGRGDGRGGPRHDHVFAHHGGPPRTQVEQACGRPAPQVQVQMTTADRIPPPDRNHGGRPGSGPGRREDGPRQPSIFELPALRPGSRPVHPQVVADRIERPQRVDGFQGVPARALEQVRQTIATDKTTAVVQQQAEIAETAKPDQPRGPWQKKPGNGSRPDGGDRGPAETVRPGIAVGEKPPGTLADAGRPERPHRPGGPDSSPPAVSTNEPATTPGTTGIVPTQPSDSDRPDRPRRPGGPDGPRPAVTANEPADTLPATGTMPGAAGQPPQNGGVAGNNPPSNEDAAAQQKAAAEKMAGEQAAVAAEAEKVRMQAQATAEQAQAAAAMQQRQQEELAAKERAAAAEKMTAEQAQAAAEAEKARMQAAAEQTQREQAQAAAMQQRQQEEAAAQQRAAAEKMAADQAQAAAAEAEKARMQAAAAEEAQREQAQAAAMQQRQQEEAAAQQRAAAERMAAQQEEAARRAQEMAERQAEEQARRAQQEMAQRQAEEQARRAQEEAQRQAQEMAQRQAEEQARRAQQEMAQRQAEEQARRAQEEAQRQAQEMAQRQAEEQARRAQEMAQRQAEEQARRAQEEAQRAAQEAAQRAAQEAAQRAAEEAARNRPPGS